MKRVAGHTRDAILAAAAAEFAARGFAGASVDDIAASVRLQQGDDLLPLPEQAGALRRDPPRRLPLDGRPHRRHRRVRPATPPPRSRPSSTPSTRWPPARPYMPPIMMREMAEGARRLDADTLRLMAAIFGNLARILDEGARHGRLPSRRPDAHLLQRSSPRSSSSAPPRRSARRSARRRILDVAGRSRRVRRQPEADGAHRPGAGRPGDLAGPRSPDSPAAVPARPVLETTHEREALVSAVPLALAAALLAAGCASKTPTDRVRASGNVEATEVQVSPKVGGRLLELKVDEGDRVKEGQVLARARHDRRPARAAAREGRPRPGRGQARAARGRLARGGHPPGRGAGRRAPRPTSPAPATTSPPPRPTSSASRRCSSRTPAPQKQRDDAATRRDLAQGAAPGGRRSASAPRARALVHLQNGLAARRKSPPPAPGSPPPRPRSPRSSRTSPTPPSSRRSPASSARSWPTPARSSRRARPS